MGGIEGEIGQQAIQSNLNRSVQGCQRAGYERVQIQQRLGHARLGRLVVTGTARLGTLPNQGS